MKKIIKGYVRYFKYVCRHKYYVGKMCFRYGMYWQGIVHDMSKFNPIEYKYYMRHFSLGMNDEDTMDKFNKAWLHHIHSNPHHRQYWILQNDDGTQLAIDMPKKYITEMLCDWRGVGRSFAKGELVARYKKDEWFEVRRWYRENESKMKLSEKTRGYIEWFLFYHG